MIYSMSDDYNQNTSQNSTDFANNSTSNFSNFNNQIMPETTTTSTDNSSQKTPTKTQKVAKKPSPLIQAIQTKKALYARIKSAFIKQLSQNIDEGKSTASLDMDRFIVGLIEAGLKG